MNKLDYYLGVLYSNDMAGLAYMRNNNVVEHYINQTYIIKTYIEEALKFIDHNKNKSFFYI